MSLEHILIVLMINAIFGFSLFIWFDYILIYIL